MKVILDHSFSDRIGGKLVSYAPGTALELPEVDAQRLVERGHAHSFAKNQNEVDAMAEAEKLPVAKPVEQPKK